MAGQVVADTRQRVGDALQKAIAAGTEAAAQLVRLDDAAEKVELSVRASSGADRSNRDFAWHLYGQQQANTLVPNIDPSSIPFYEYLSQVNTMGLLGGSLDTLNSAIDETNRLYTVWNNAEGDGFLSRVYQVVGTGVYDITGASNGYRAITGGDHVTLQQYSTGQRWLQAGIGLVKFGSTATGAANAWSGARGSLSRWLNPCGCFDFDTGVKEFAPEAVSQTWLVVAAGVIVGGGGWIGVEEVRRRKRLAIGLAPEPEDPLLAPDHQHDDHVWMMTRDDESLPGMEDGEDFDVLCDLLFNGPPRSSGRK